MKFKSNDEIKNYLENLEGFEGYVQISNRPIDKEKDIFINKKIKIEDENNGFIVEGAFYKNNKSIMINFVNGEWLLSEYDLKDNIKYEKFNTKIKDFNKKIRLAQIFEELEEEIFDVNEENKEKIKTIKLKSVVFAGFEGDEK